MEGVYCVGRNPNRKDDKGDDMYAEQLLPEPRILPPNDVSVYVPTSFTEYSFYRGGQPRNILAAPTAGNHGDRLRTNKQLLRTVFDNLRIAPDRRIFMLAIAMQESQTMSPGERDWTKDCTTNDSANYSIFNINLDFIRFVTGSDPPSSLPLVDNSGLINTTSVGAAADIINKAIDKLGSPTRVLVFHSGGRTAYKAMTPTDIDPKRLLKGHADAIKTIMKRLEDDAGLQNDPRRVGIAVQHH
jgi:hypothetical protein